VSCSRACVGAALSDTMILQRVHMLVTAGSCDVEALQRLRGSSRSGDTHLEARSEVSGGSRRRMETPERFLPADQRIYASAFRALSLAFPSWNATGKFGEDRSRPIPIGGTHELLCNTPSIPARHLLALGALGAAAAQTGTNSLHRPRHALCQGFDSRTLRSSRRGRTARCARAPCHK